LGQRCSTFHDFSRVGIPNPKCLSTGSSGVLLLGAGVFSFLGMKICMATVILRGYILTILKMSFGIMKNEFWFRIAVIALGGLPIGLMILAVYK
jgi:hypothetical protein